MTGEIIIALFAFIPLVFISYGIGWHRGYKDASKTLKEVYKLFLKPREESDEDDE